MNENIIVNDVILSKKTESYGYENKNFKASGEIMVTITLDEYRSLVKSTAISDSELSKLRSEKYTVESQLAALQKENSELKSKLYELANDESVSKNG